MFKLLVNLRAEGNSRGEHVLSSLFLFDFCRSHASPVEQPVRQIPEVIDFAELTVFPHLV
jgi:hypothetical protein